MSMNYCNHRHIPTNLLSYLLLYREDTSAHIVLQDLQGIPTTPVIIWVTAIQAMPEVIHAVNMLGAFDFKAGEITSVRYFKIFCFRGLHFRDFLDSILKIFRFWVAWFHHAQQLKHFELFSLQLNVCHWIGLLYLFDFSVSNRVLWKWPSLCRGLRFGWLSWRWAQLYRKGMSQGETKGYKWERAAISFWPNCNESR